MKKLLLIMAAALMTMTQCRKQETMPVTPATDTVKMTITAGPGRTDINTATGAITWSAGDRLYVSDGTNWLGSLTLVGEGGSAQGTFTGSIAGIGEGETPCHFFYLGHDNGMTEPTASSSDPVSISFAAQDGTLDGAMKYHIGYGNTNVTEQDGEYAGYVIMNTKIAIAHINFTDGTSAYTGSLTMGGTGIFNTLSVNPDGTFSGSGDEGITIGNGGGTTGERYVTLIPTTETDVVRAEFTGDATGGMTFANGIQANKFYGMKDAVKVTVEAAAPKFSVGENTTVEFAPGNLYWDGSAFKFEANQWDFSVEWNELFQNYYWDASHVSHFKWSDAANAVTGDNSYSGDLFCANNFTVAGHTWRTLTNDEWNYLLNSRTGASSLRAWVTLSNVSVSGLVLLPDGSTATASGVTTSSALADAGAVFLPAAGSRFGTGVYGVGSYGYYWSGTPYEDNENAAYYVAFYSRDVYKGSGGRHYGYAVRLVR